MTRFEYHNIRNIAKVEK